MDDQEIVDWISHNMYLQIEKDMDILINQINWDMSDPGIVDGHFEVREWFARLIKKACPKVKLNYEDFDSLKTKWEEEKKERKGG